MEEIAPPGSDVATHEPLRYAPPPPASSRTPGLVLIAGLVTTALTLLGLHFVQQHSDTDIMSFTVKYIIPLGALGVGFVAGLGYGIAAYVLNVRVHGWLIWIIVMLQIWAYFAAHYVEFRAEGPMFFKDTGQRVGFLEYYHYNTTHMVWVSSSSSNRTNSSAPRSELGMTGYFYRGLGILGFVLGGVIIPLVQRTMPYCPLCQRYMKSKSLLKMPATAKAKAKLSGKFTLDTPEHKEQMQKSLDALKQATDALVGGRVDELRQCVKQNEAKVPAKVPVFAHLTMVYCRQCWQGTYSAALKNNGNYQTALAQTLASGNVEPGVVRVVVDPSSAAAAARSASSTSAAPA